MRPDKRQKHVGLNEDIEHLLRLSSELEVLNGVAADDETLCKF